MADSALPTDISRYYDAGREQGRLERPTGALERLRTQEVIARYAPPPPAVVADIGGGFGPYAYWLAERGYMVHLVDATPLHIQQASEAAASHTARLASLTVADARHLPFPDASMDLVLLLGPLYHLTERADRLAAWSEARRVARDGGVIVAAGISRNAPLMDGLFRGYLDDPGFKLIVRQDLATGQHRNPTNHPSYFATAYLHQPQELREEAEEAGWRHTGLLAVEGALWLSPLALERIWDHQLGPRYLDMLRLVERDPATLAISAHILEVARK